MLRIYILQMKHKRIINTELKNRITKVDIDSYNDLCNQIIKNIIDK